MKEFRVTVNGQTYNVLVEELAQAPVFPRVAAEEQDFKATPPQTENVAVTAPMPGVVQKIFVAAGQTVQKGEVLLVLEAMKLENEIVAPQAGTVKAVYVSEGTTVNTGDSLVSLA